MPQRQSLLKLNKPPDMKRKPTIKNSEKIWKLEYLEPNFHQEPDDQNEVNEDQEEDKQTKSNSHRKNQ